MRRPSLPLLAVALAAVCAVLAACGGSNADLIPPRPAADMERQLDRIKAAVDGGSCSDVGTDVARLQREVNALPNRVDAALRQRLQEGVDNLARTAPDECLAQSQSTQTTPTETTPTTPTETTPTTPTETTTTPPVETTPPPVTTPPPATTPVPPDGSGGATVPPSDGGATPQP